MTTRILIVDDRLEELDTALAWLRQDGYEVITATRSDEALRLVELTPPDLVLVSLVMPGLDGRAVCRWLRRNPGTSRVPIILIADHDGAQADAGEAGANGFITRPVQLTDVRQRIESLLRVDDGALDDNRRLLEETCQTALAILPCNLAWMLVAEPGPEQTMLVSHAIATDRGSNAGQVFLRLVGENTPGEPSFPLRSGQNPLSEAALRSGPMINIPVKQLQTILNGNALYRAAHQLRLAYVHFLPLHTAGQIIGLLVLGAKEMHDSAAPRGQQIVTALTSQAATVVKNARLVRDLAERESQMRAEQSFRKMILDTMGDGLAVIDEQAVIRYANNRLLRMSGYSRPELTGTSVGVIFPPALRDHLTGSLRRQSRATVNFSQQIFTKEGRVVPVLMSRATAGSMGDWSTVLVFTDLTEQKQREQALERRSVQLQTLNRAVQAMTSALTLDDVLTILVQSAVEIVRSADACMFLKDSNAPDRLRVAAATGAQAETLRGAFFPIADGLAGEVVRTGRPRLMPSVPPQQPDERPRSSVIAVPVAIMEQMVGVLQAFNPTGGDFVQGDVEILENLTAAAGVAIQNATLFEQTERRVSELSTLLEASAAVSSTLDIGSILELIARRLAEALKVARCSIAIANRPARQLTVLAEVCNAYWPLGQGPLRGVAATPLSLAAMKSGKCAIIHNDDPALRPPIRDQLDYLKMRTLLLVPAQYDQVGSGVIELYSPKGREAFTPQAVHAIEEAIAEWREQTRRANSPSWHERDSLTDLYHRIMFTVEASWCVMSAWHQQDLAPRIIREIGFALWKEESGGVFRLDDYPAMAQSLTQSAPVTLHAESLDHDPNELKTMKQMGTHSGLIMPLVVRGEASGLVKLLDVAAGRNFDIAEISLCQGIANVLGSAIENAQLYQSLARRANALQAAYDELRQADRVKDDLIQNLSHELQTPLHQVIMQVDLVAQDAFGPLNSQQKEHMKVIMTRITQLADLIRNMLSMQALDTQHLHFAETRVEDIVESAVRKQTPIATQAGLQIVSALPREVSSTWVDAQRVSQVLEELIDNAIKFSPKNERKADQIDVQVDDTGAALVRVSVRDYGIGIQQTEFDNIFQRGYQVDGSMTRRFSGAGLGLSLARQIVEAHGGKIWVDSKPGEGSQFYFTIPKIGVQFQHG
jgi:PAS domain S-box-containing protein